MVTGQDFLDGVFAPMVIGINAVASPPHSRQKVSLPPF